MSWDKRRSLKSWSRHPGLPPPATRSAIARRLVAWRRPIAWIAHAPGLWFFFGETPSKRLRRTNLIAVALTLVAVGSVVALVHYPYRLPVVLIVWGICHVIWGSYLAWQLPSISPDDKSSPDKPRSMKPPNGGQ